MTTDLDYRTFEVIGALVVVLDRDGRIVHWNQACSDLSGYDLASVRGRHLWDELLDPDDVARFQAAFTAIGDDEHPRQVSSWWRTKAGERRWIVWSQAVTGEHVVQTGIDRTWRRRAEAARERRHGILAGLGEAVLASTLDALLTGVARVALEHLADCCAIDLVEEDGAPRQGTVLLRDPTTSALRPVPASDGRPPSVVTSAVASRHSCLLAAAAAPDLAAISPEAERLRGARSLIVVPLAARELLGALVLVSPAADRFGPDEVSLAEELAHRAALAIENARLQERLRRIADGQREANEKLVLATLRAQESADEADAARALFEESWRRQRELAVDNARLLGKAEAAVAARERLLGIVAHDLRNPLAAVRLHADALQRREANGGDGNERAVEAIARAVHRMQRLVDDLLDVARSDAGGISIDPRPVRTVPLLEEVGASQAPLLEAAHLTLTTVVEDDPSDVWADRDRILRVFENLLGNAIKFSRPGGRITIGAVRPGEEEVLFRVSDTGSGIPPEHLPHLFEAFWQADRTDRRGAGLGLPIVKNIVEAHGGRIWVESAVDVGTTVFFTLPVSPPSARAAPQGAPARAQL